MNTRRTLLTFIIWLMLAAGAAYTAWVLHTTLIYLASRLVTSETYRPFGWTSESITPLSRLSIFVMGSIWLLYAMWLENRLQNAAKELRLWRYIGRTAVALTGILIVCMVILRL